MCDPMWKSRARAVRELQTTGFSKVRQVKSVGGTYMPARRTRCPWISSVASRATKAGPTISAATADPVARKILRHQIAACIAESVRADCFLTDIAASICDWLSYHKPRTLVRSNDGACAVQKLGTVLGISRAG